MSKDLIEVVVNLRKAEMALSVHKMPTWNQSNAIRHIQEAVMWLERGE